MTIFFDSVLITAATHVIGISFCRTVGLFMTVERDFVRTFGRFSCCDERRFYYCAAASHIGCLKN